MFREGGGREKIRNLLAFNLYTSSSENTEPVFFKPVSSRIVSLLLREGSLKDYGLYVRALCRQGVYADVVAVAVLLGGGTHTLLIEKGLIKGFEKLGHIM